MPVRKLKGKKVYLGPVSESHLPILLRWMNDLDVTKYLTTAALNLNEEAEKKWRKKIKEDPSHHHYGIFLADSDKFIGGVSYKDTDPVHRTATLGIVIGEKDQWGKGYGTEAIKLMLDYGFNVLNFNNVFLSVYSFNERALKVYENTGFRVIGKRRKSKFLAGKYHDEIFMDILAEDFKDSKLKDLV